MLEVEARGRRAAGVQHNRSDEKSACSLGGLDARTWLGYEHYN
jgi:hypothetical protein